MLENQQSYQMNTKLNWDKLIAKLGERKCHFVFDEDGRCCNDNDDVHTLTFTISKNDSLIDRCPDCVHLFSVRATLFKVITGEPQL